MDEYSSFVCGHSTDMEWRLILRCPGLLWRRRASNASRSDECSTMLSRASPRSTTYTPRDMPEEDWGLRLATMQRQLEAAEEGHVS